jgi:hypothetical protein
MVARSQRVFPRVFPRFRIGPPFAARSVRRCGNNEVVFSHYERDLHRKARPTVVSGRLLNRANSAQLGRPIPEAVCFRVGALKDLVIAGEAMHW